MPITHRSVFESTQSKPTVIVAGKGGTGKSTALAAIASRLNNEGRRMLVGDLDGSPSASDSFGMSPDVRAKTMVRNDVLAIRENLDSVLIRPLLPEVTTNSCTTTEQYASQLNANLEIYTDENIHSFLPILRLAAQPEFYGVPAQTEVLAHIIQLTTLLREQVHIFTDRAQHTIEKTCIAKPDVTMLDTENTNNLLKMLSIINRLSHSMRNMANKGFVEAKFLPKNLKQYRNTKIGKNPESFIESAASLKEHMQTETGLVLVTNPGGNEITQTIDEILQLTERGKPPDHIIMNRWPSRKKDRRLAKIQEKHFLATLDLLEADIGYSRVQPNVVQLVVPGEDAFQELQLQNLENLADCI